MNNADTQAFRRLALASWINDKGGFKQVCIDRKLNASAKSHIRHVLRGHCFGPQSARNFETKLGMLQGWLDSVDNDFDIPNTGSKMINTERKQTILATFASGLAADFDTLNIPQYPKTGSIINNSDCTLRSRDDLAGSRAESQSIITDMRVSIDWLKNCANGYTDEKNLFLFTGMTNSEHPHYCLGDPILLDIGVRTVKSNAIYFFQFEDQFFIKRLQRASHGEIQVIRSDQPDDCWFVTPDMDFKILGKVLKIWRSDAQ